MIAAIEELAPSIGVSQACAVFAFPRSSLYRRRRPHVTSQRSHPAPPRSLSAEERATVRAVRGENALPTRPRMRSMPRCWMRRFISAPSARCIGFCMRWRKCRNAALNCAIRPIPNPSCWRRRLTGSGPGISPNSGDRRPGSTSIYRSFSMSLAALSSAGSWRTMNLRNWRNNSSPQVARSKALHVAKWFCMQIAVRR